MGKNIKQVYTKSIEEYDKIISLLKAGKYFSKADAILYEGVNVHSPDDELLLQPVEEPEEPETSGSAMYPEAVTVIKPKEKLEPSKTPAPKKMTLKSIKENFEIMFKGLEGALPVKDLSVDRYWVPFIENYRLLGHITKKQEKDWSYEYWPDDVPREEPKESSEELEKKLEQNIKTKPKKRPKKA